MVEQTAAKIKNMESMNNRKINLYSGHDFTIVALLGALGVFKPHQPPYGSYMILEVHKMGYTHGIKVNNAYKNVFSLFNIYYFRSHAGILSRLHGKSSPAVTITQLSGPLSFR